MKPGPKCSILQGTEKVCYLTGRTDQLEKHHIFNGAYRKKSDDFGFWIWVTHDWHTGKNYAIHNDGKLRERLKAECQKTYMEETKCSMEMWKLIINKNYLEVRE